jgi:alpha-tubulin suppressor-like RCC1 family protein
MRSSIFALFGAALIGGCAEPTALLVFIDSDLPLDRVTVEVTGTDGVVTTPIATMDFAMGERPVQLTLVPDGSHRVGDDVEIEVKGFIGADEVIDSTVVASFTGGETRYLTIYLWEVCAGFECVEGDVCVADADSVAGDCETERRAALRWDGDAPPPIGMTTDRPCDASCWHECSERTPTCETPVDLALGGSHSCARTAEGHVFCWGDNEAGQLGHVSATGRPAIVADLEGVTTLGASDRTTCASDDEGRAWCWGFGFDAQLGRGVEPEGSLTPVNPDGLVEGDFVDQVGCGPITNCVLLRPAGGGDVEVRCFGVNRHFSGGVEGGLVDSPTQPVMDVNDALSVHPGLEHTCAVVNEGDTNEVVCWGWARTGRLGDGNLDDVDEAAGQPVIGDGGNLRGVQQLAVGEDNSCALVLDGGTRRLRCWGPNVDRELGTGNGDDTAPFLWDATATSGPELATGAEITGWTFVAMGLRQGCGILDGAVWCWGWGNDGALGTGPDEHAIPTAVTNPEALGVATLVALGGRRDIPEPANSVTHACALLDGAIHCWGDNGVGQLGLPSAGDLVTEPTRLGQ